MRKASTGAFCFILGLGILLSAGCGDKGPKLGKVRGTVTKDGTPLPDVMVEFQPAKGSPSKAITDANGQYELMYTREKKGALPGTHTVTVTTRPSQDSDEEKPAKVLGRLKNIEVATGSNDIPLPLKSEPAEPEE